MEFFCACLFIRVGKHRAKLHCSCVCWCILLICVSVLFFPFSSLVQTGSTAADYKQQIQTYLLHLAIELLGELANGAVCRKARDVSESVENQADSPRDRVGPAGLHHSQTRSAAPSLGLGLRLKRDAAAGQKCQTAEEEEKKERVTNQGKENKRASARARARRVCS